MEDVELDQLRKKRFAEMAEKIPPPEGRPIVHMTEYNFNAVMLKSENVVIDFWAEWCGPCRYFGPIFEEVALEYPEVQFCKCDTNWNHGIVTQLKITNIPLVMYNYQRDRGPDAGLGDVGGEVPGRVGSGIPNP